MAKIIEIQNLNYKSDKISFNDFNLSIQNKSFTSILGKNGSGKTTLIDLIIGNLDYNGKILINNIELNKDNKKNIRKLIEVIFEDYEDMFLGKTVYDDICFSIQGEYTKVQIDGIIDELKYELGIENILNRKISTLSDSEKERTILASMLVSKPSILIIDNSLNNIDYYDRIKIFNYIKKQGITVINITNNLDDILLSDKVILLDEGKIVLNSTVSKALNSEKEFNKCSISLPFMADLSNKLRYYELVDKIILDKDELVDTLWK